MASFVFCDANILLAVTILKNNREKARVFCRFIITMCGFGTNKGTAESSFQFTFSIENFLSYLKAGEHKKIKKV